MLIGKSGSVEVAVVFRYTIKLMVVATAQGI